jgi:Zn-dependent metalloprotease
MVSHSLFLAAVLAATPTSSPQGPQQPLGTAVATTAQLAAKLGDPLARLSWDDHGQLHRAYGQLGKLGSGAGGVEAFLRARSGPLGLRADEVLQVIDDASDSKGFRHVHVNRQLHGLAVDFQQLRLHAAPDGQVYALEAELGDLLGYQYVAPQVLPQTAVQTARRGFLGKLTDATQPTLTLLTEVLPGVHGAHLAYRVRIAYARKGQLPIGDDVYVDANTGDFLHAVPRVYSGTPTTMQSTDLAGQTRTLNVTSYSDGVGLKDTVTLPNGGSIATYDQSNGGQLYATPTTSQAFGDAQAVSVADNVHTAINFYVSSFGWDHWNFASTPAAKGGLLAGIAHVGTQLNNAYFTTTTNNGQTFGTMNFGDGDGQAFTPLAKALDVTGHELGHGVVAGTADLVYENQSGAMNESYADVFGWLIDPSNETIGESVVGPSLQPALRNMCDPHQGQDSSGNLWQPASMSEYQNLPNDDDHDHGGVHTNSGVTNHAACLFKKAVSFDHMGQLWFKALKDHLHSTDGFQDLVNGTANACVELGYPASECNALGTAFTTVGLQSPTVTAGGQQTCPANAHLLGGACQCDAGYKTNAAGSGCDAVQTTTCPANATSKGGYCYCNAGYITSPDGLGCIPDANCPSHSHKEGAACVCDDCYQGTPVGGDAQGCQAVPACAVCADPLQLSVNGTCQCVPGLTMDANGKCTQPITGNCGNENWGGRCLDDHTLVYCGNEDNAAIQAIEVVNCPTVDASYVCGNDPEGGFNCLAARTDCGAVTDKGVCTGASTAQYCASGVLQTVDCGSSGCSTYTYQGATYNYCSPCPAHATIDGTACKCDTGYQANAAGTGCDSVNGTGTTGGSTGDSSHQNGPGDSGGSSCTVVGGGINLLLLGLLAPLLRRRR